MKYTGPVTLSSQPGVALQQYASVATVGDEILLEQNGQTLGRWSTSEASVSVQTTQRAERYTPGWAIALGILGSFFFLIGILFFFVKQTRWVNESAASITVGGVAVVSLHVVSQEPIAATPVQNSISAETAPAQIDPA